MPSWDIPVTTEKCERPPSVYMRNMEWYPRNNNIEISEIPVTTGEDTFCVLKGVDTTIGVEIKKEEVNATQRVLAFKAEKTQTPMVQETPRW